MKKVWFICSLLGIVTLWVVDATFTYKGKEFTFLDGAQPILSADVKMRSNYQTHLETYNLHVPFDEVWSNAEVELIDHKGWRLGDHTAELQNFNLPSNNETVSLIRGKVDNHADFIPGTETTDTYIEVRKRL